MLLRILAAAIVLILAGCAQPNPGVDQADLAPPTPGDQAWYEWHSSQGLILVHVEVFDETPGIQRWEQTWQQGNSSRHLAQWLDDDGNVLAAIDGSELVWFDLPCQASWFSVIAADCPGWSHDVQDGNTRMWRPMQWAREALPAEPATVTWGGEDIDATLWSLAATRAAGGEMVNEYLLRMWADDAVCFPLVVEDDKGSEPWLWTLVHSICDGVAIGEPPGAEKPETGFVRLPDRTRQPSAACTGHIGANDTSLAVERPFSCGIYDAFGLFFLAPKQGLRVTAEWAGVAPNGMRLEADGEVVDGDVPPLILELDAFSAPLDEIRIELADNAVAFDPMTPDRGRAVKITLEGYSLD